MPPVDISRSRLAVAAGFLTQGLILLSLTTRLPEFQDRWDISDVQLSLILLMMILLAGAGSVVAEALAKRKDSALLLRAGLLVVAIGVASLCLAPSMGFYIGGIALYGLGLGVVDATTNMQAVALEHRYERPILPSFHGAWTLGGVIGAAVTLATTDLPLEACAALAVIPLLVAFGPFLPRDHGPTELPADVAVPWRPILLVGLAMVLFYMVDTAVQTWGPLFLDHTFSTPERYVALSALGYLLASGIVRLAGDSLVARFGPVLVLRVGALIGAGCARHRRVLDQLADGRRRLLDPGRRRGRGGPAELLRGRQDRRRRGLHTRAATGPGGRRHRAVQPVQLRRRTARLGAHRPDRRGLAADRLRAADDPGALHHPARPGVRTAGRGAQVSPQLTGFRDASVSPSLRSGLTRRSSTFAPSRDPR